MVLLYSVHIFSSFRSIFVLMMQKQDKKLTKNALTVSDNSLKNQSSISTNAGTWMLNFARKARNARFSFCVYLKYGSYVPLRSESKLSR